MAGSLLNRTIRPSRYTGCTSGVPGSRPWVNSRFNALKAGDPANRMPSVRLAMSTSPPNGVSIMNEPRLNPNAYSLGRLIGG